MNWVLTQKKIQTNTKKLPFELNEANPAQKKHKN